MKIALMTNNYKPVMGGVPISIERLAKTLRDYGNEVIIFAPTYEGQDKSEYGVFRYKTALKKFIGGIVLPYPFDPKIDKKFEEEKFDIIHVHHPFLIGNEAVRLSKKYNIPLSFTYHTRYDQYISAYSNLKSENLNEKIVSKYINNFSRQCDIVFAPTKSIKDYLMDFCNIEGKKIYVLPTGLERNAYDFDGDKVKEIRKKYVKHGEYLFTTVSRVSEEKNIDFLIESIESLKKKTRMPFKLLVIGDGPQRMKYENKCREQGIYEVEFIGKVSNEEIKNYNRAADAFLFSSKTETQGIVIIEAMAVGTPVIAIEADGVRDVVKNSENGILTGDNIDEYVSKLYAFMRGDIDIDALSENAINMACKYREEIIAANALLAYEKAISSHEDRKEKKRGIYGRQVQYFVS